MTSAYRKPRYVLRKVVAGVSSDWQWYTHIAALRRAAMAPHDYGRMLAARVVRVAGSPVDFGAPAPDENVVGLGLGDLVDVVAPGETRVQAAIASAVD